MATSPILDSVYTMLDDMIAFLPTLIAVILLLIVGKIAGKALGKIGSKILDKIGLDDLIDRTSIGKMIERTNITTVEFFDAAIRWFVYFIFAVIIIDLLNVQIVADFITQIILYIPLILSAIVVLIIGLIVVDFLANLIKNVLIATGIDERISATSLGNAMNASGMTSSSLVALIVQIFGYLLFIMAALNILNLGIIAGVVQSILVYLPNLFAGVVILLIGLLAIDMFADYIGGLLENMNVEGTNIWIPALRGFLAFIVILLALDALLIDTSIFYAFIGPLAWGIAVVVAFKWGIKDALVEYAKARK
ncbi:mechanosensitive ion channel family protein [Methanolobus sp. WCC5]|uniref:mechanosensitive ion channel family protein n=1 Tax=Methanolobus sp. WCC5 TaxID=3125785 RepID=UPI00325438FA